MMATTSESLETAEILSPANLREKSAWIRDELDIIVAREGGKELSPDDVLTIHDILVSLKNHTITKWTLRYSRIGLAVETIRGKATRWPTKLADEADEYAQNP